MIKWKRLEWGWSLDLRSGVLRVYDFNLSWRIEWAGQEVLTSKDTPKLFDTDEQAKKYAVKWLRDKMAKDAEALKWVDEPDARVRKDKEPK